MCEWADKVNWAIKPIKKIRQRWLVSATDTPVIGEQGTIADIPSD